MFIKRLRIAICLFSLIFLIFLAWDNILILDDYEHNFHEDVFQPAAEQEQTEAEQESAPEVQDVSLNNIVKKGFHIHINLDERQMYVYKNGELLKTYPCSGGKSGTPSPLGTWRIVGKDTWGEGFGGAWLAINVPWGKYGIHGTVYPWQIGKQNGSKGCIRMLNKDVRELYRLVPHGTTVTIVQESRTFRTMKSGDIGSDVKEMQQALQKLGYYKGYPDGKFGSGLQAAVRKFQKANTIWTSGIINRKTYNTILEKLGQVETHG